MAKVYIAIGSNLKHPLQQANAAILALSQMNEVQVTAVSPFYRSKPLGPADQPDYLNAVIAVETSLSPEALLNITQQIEQEQGRERKAHRWGPRTLDLDILLYDNQTIQTARLIIPHYDMKNREFVLYPLFDLAPNLIFPDGEALAERLKLLPLNGMIRWIV
ncbi:2-amino-4-hydroxy-6-hydroxymethyldihydropteridine diphosphokinase [Utexia brackfieldae]|uniref:2-amino-4-hydroxy-6- hydroxymethyldihydropteridine diphosphokinase n=1 Tax=Utexia brackfieldae TaxID=3074108 RepID=UPI00370DCF69